MAREAKVPVFKGERLDLKTGVKKDAATGRIVSITMEGGKTFAGKVFIDATYEGDLMAKAGVSYTVGREANAQYGETSTASSSPPSPPVHQARRPLRQARRPLQRPAPRRPRRRPRRGGQGDKRVQAYNFRLCLTDRKANQLPFPKPAGYDPLRYELLLRYLEARASST